MHIVFLDPVPKDLCCGVSLGEDELYEPGGLLLGWCLSLQATVFLVSCRLIRVLQLQMYLVVFISYLSYINSHNTFCSLKCSNTGSTLFRRWIRAAWCLFTKVKPSNATKVYCLKTADYHSCRYQTHDIRKQTVPDAIASASISLSSSRFWSSALNRSETSSWTVL